MKRLFIIVTLLLGIAVVAMLLTKPEPEKHYQAVRELAQSVMDQELTSDNVKSKIAQVGAEKLADLGIEGVDADMLESLGADVDLTEVTEVGKSLAMTSADMYLRSHLTVDDYAVVNVGMVNFRGRSLPISVGVFGKVFVLADEEQVKQVLRY
jgi:hypothetical protein